MDVNEQLRDLFKPMKRVPPCKVFLGEAKALSKRRARKIAFQYRSSNLGARYKAYLDGDSRGFHLIGKRLVRLPKIG